MFYHFLYPLKEYWAVFNVFKYITFRSVGSSVTAFLICTLCGQYCIQFLKSLGAVEPTGREHAPQLDPLYQHKHSIPSMGGILIIGAVLVSNLLWGNFSSKYMVLILTVTIWLGFVGFIDDFVKIKTKSSRGIPAVIKLMGQLILGLILGIFLYHDPAYQKVLYVPFLKEYVIYLGIFFIPFVVVVIVGSSNALNITDGLDGLAIGCAVIVAATFSIVSYISGHSTFAAYLNIAYITQSGELAVFCASLIGAGVGFLWFNSYPASVFMGDTGALAIGGAIGAIALFIKKELLLLIVGGVFVWEAISVIMQIVGFKLFKKRIFLMAPFHHHLQLNKWHEAKITVRLWIIAFILALIGLGTLKLQ
ncbi:MAG: phospho-N-acetylmuramoyl-pentapeptide-transferase [Candidatus Omnitrophica bacterium]|nr:phospho-N-acetylmuramoyl-pentapeptide-transferase [Candidatus Omnitrophota bacterium]